MKLLTASRFALEVERRASEFLVALFPVVLGAVGLSFNTADRADRSCLDLIHRSLGLGVGNSRRDTSSNTTGSSNTATDGTKSNIKGNSDQDSRAALDRGSNGDGAEESLERNHIED